MPPGWSTETEEIMGKAKKKNGSKHTGTSRQDSDMTEPALYDWMLAQRILHDAGALDAWKVGELRSFPGSPIDEAPTDDELGHAIYVDHEELNEALETWWNTMQLSSIPLTFAEIRVKAALEM